MALLCLALHVRIYLHNICLWFVDRTMVSVSQVESALKEKLQAIEVVRLFAVSVGNYGCCCFKELTDMYAGTVQKVEDTSGGYAFTAVCGCAQRLGHRYYNM